MPASHPDPRNTKGTRVNRASNHAANERTMDDLVDAFAPMYQPNSWLTILSAYAQRGYPTGGDSNGSSNTINRPTERIAMAPLDEPGRRLKRAQELTNTIRSAARELNAIRLYTITTAEYRDPDPIPCRNINCPNIMERHKGESPRDGRCPRCATHHRRYTLEWPHKHLTMQEPDAAKNPA